MLPDYWVLQYVRESDVPTVQSDKILLWLQHLSYTLRTIIICVLKFVFFRSTGWPISQLPLASFNNNNF